MVEIATVAPLHFANAKCKQRNDIDITVMTIGRNRPLLFVEIGREIVMRKMLLIYKSTYIIIYL